MGELQAAVDASPSWIAIIWCFYPMTVFVLFQIIVKAFDNDDDSDGGKMIPAFQTLQR